MKEQTIKELKELNDKLDTIIVLLNNINVKAATVSRDQKSSSHVTDRFNLVDALYKNGLPNDKDYIEDLDKVITRLELDSNQVTEVFNRLNKYQLENDVKDIKKLSFKFLYNYKEDLDRNRAQGGRGYKPQVPLPSM